MTDIEAEAGLRIGEEVRLPSIGGAPAKAGFLRALCRTGPEEIEALIETEPYVIARRPSGCVRPLRGPTT